LRHALAALALGLAFAPAASAAERRLLVNGDSIAEGTRPYIPRELPGWRVRQSTAVSGTPTRARPSCAATAAAWRASFT
jgi:hypothetical protein